jgi:hypothetical protein
MIGTGSVTGIATMVGGNAAVTNRGTRYHGVTGVRRAGTRTERARPS